MVSLHLKYKCIQARYQVCRVTLLEELSNVGRIVPSFDQTNFIRVILRPKDQNKLCVENLIPDTGSGR